MSVIKIKIIIGCIIFFLIAFISLDVRADETKNFITLADIHFSPYIGCDNKKPCVVLEKLIRAPANQWAVILNAEHSKFSGYHQDTNYPLLISALQAAKRTATVKQAQFVIILGDTLAHDYRRLYKYYTGTNDIAAYQAFVYKTYQFINIELSRAFPSLDVYMTVGNNDSYMGDYVTQVQGAFFQNQGVLWSELIKNAPTRSAMRHSFPTAGYYAVNIPNNNIRLIVLNTNLFSSHARGKNVKGAAITQLKWLHNQLAEVKQSKQTAWIAMHIPEGIDVFSSLHIRGLTLIKLWKKEYMDQFEVNMLQFAPQITAIFSGHLHSDWSQELHYDNSVSIPATGTPSISPVYGNNPGYKLYTYSPVTNRLVDSSTYYFYLGGQSDWGMKYQYIRLKSTVS